MRVGTIIGRFGGVDGVALEAAKWIAVLRRMGHEVYVLAGELEGRAPDAATEDLLPGLSFYGPECSWEQKHAFFGGDAPAQEVLERISGQADVIARAIEEWARRRRLDALLVENALALPFHLSMGVGIHRAAAGTGLATIAHDHDFHWERPQRYHSEHEAVNRLVEEHFPARLPNVLHAVINTPARDILRERFGVEATVIPNVMDFDRPFGERNAFNASLPADLGLAEDDIPLFQVTRIVRRKGIEVAVKLVHALADERVKLVITGSPTDDPGGQYVNELKHQVTRLGLQRQVRFAHRHFAHEPYVTAAGNKVYGLTDAYAHARACTFFSTYEGFGNAFVEAVLARRPIFVNNYEPVYKPDIAAHGFKTVCIEDHELTPAAVAGIREVLHDDSLRRDIAAHNFELGRRHFSFEVLRTGLESLLKRL